MPRGMHRLLEPAVPRLVDWLRGSPSGLIAMAIATGAGAGVGAVAFRYLILGFTVLFTGRHDYSAAGHAANPLVPALGMWFVLLVPAVGGLIYGPLIQVFAREARGHGVPEVMYAVSERGGRIRPQVAVVKSLASAICIGAGGSVGREGPIVQIGSALGSSVGQMLRVSESRLRLLVACGAAGGISATFNAPIAGVFFALELILRDFETQSFGVVVLASVTAAVIGRTAFGSAAFLTLPPFHITSNWEYLFYALLGLLAAGVGVGFIRVLYGIEDLCDALWRGPEWLRPAVGGLLLGLLLLLLPELYGVGYPVLEAAIRGHYVLWFLLVLLAGKLVATSLTIGIGGSGGVFAPSLFMGALVGSAYGQVLHSLLPGISSAGAYGLVGMGAVFAGAARAPITAILIIFELTDDYTIILPLMCAVVLATGVSNLLSHDTIYTLKLRRRGIDILRGRAANLMEVLTVAAAMRPMPDGLPENAPLNEVIERFTQGQFDALPVAEGTGAFRGTVTLSEVEQAIRENALDAVAGDLAQMTATLRADQSLEQALGLLVRQDQAGLPVLAADGHRVIGWLTHRDVLRAYNERLERSVSQARRGAGPPVPGQRRITVGTTEIASPTAAIPPTVPAPAADDESLPAPLASLRDYRIVDLELTREQPPAGKRVHEVRWPPSSLLIAVRRGSEAFTPNGQTDLRKGDRLTILVRAEHAEDIAKMIDNEPH